MKTYKNIYLLLTIALIASCNGILEENPTTFYNEEQTFSSEEGIETAVNGLYTSFSEGAYHGSSWHGLIAPVSGRFFSNQGASVDATSLNTSPINTWLTRLWPAMYSTINTANVIINNLEGATESFSNIETALAQAYFIRGLTYFELVQLFGDVPLRTEPTTSKSLHAARAQKSEVYELLISDLKKAKEMLPDFGEYRPERPTKYAANVYLAKVYMRLAGEDGGKPELWNNAKSELQPVIGRYSLTATFAELWEAGNENTSESIFELQYAHVGGIRNSDIIRMFTPKNSVEVPANQNVFGRIRPNKEVFDEHLEVYPGDPRIDATYFYDSYEQHNNKSQSIYPSKTSGNDGFPVIAKFFDPTYNGTTTDRNFILLRYADVLLMMAEIENELSSPEAAYEYVNQVLERARDIDGDGISDVEVPANWSGMSKDAFRDAILRERQFELLAEGHDWFDTRRRGYEYFLQEVIEKHNKHPMLDNPGKDFIYPVSIKNMLLPIPSSEISGNQLITQADQNPGY